MSKWTHKGIMDWLATKAPMVSPAQFKVLFALSRYANKETGQAFPSMATIAEDCGTSVGNVHKLINELADIGCIGMEAGKPGRGKVSRYWLIGDDADMVRFKQEQAARRAERRAGRSRYANGSGMAYANGGGMSRQQFLARQAAAAPEPEITRETIFARDRERCAQAARVRELRNRRQERMQAQAADLASDDAPAIAPDGGEEHPEKSSLE
jgi:hypothetical protein